MIGLSTNRRTFLGGASSALAAFILGSHPGARLIRAQGSATYDAIVLSKFEFNVVSDGRLPLAGPGDIAYVTPSGGACGAIAVSNERISPAVWSSTGKLKRLKSGKMGGAAIWSDNNETIVGLQQEIDPAYNLPVTKPTVWRDGEPSILPGLDGQITGYATVIEPDGVIFGYLAGQTGVRWVEDQPEALPLTNGLSTFNPVAVLQNGDILGVGACSSAPCVARISNGAVTFTELPADSYGVIPVGTRYGMGGTSSGLIVGVTGASGGFVSFKIEDGEFSYIENPEGSELLLTNMNESGLAIGALREGRESVAVTWQDGEVTDLNTVSNTDGLPLRLATGINDDGVIACISDADANQPTALLLVPVA